MLVLIRKRSKLLVVWLERKLLISSCGGYAILLLNNGIRWVEDERISLNRVKNVELHHYSNDPIVVIQSVKDPERLESYSSSYEEVLLKLNTPERATAALIMLEQAVYAIKEAREQLVYNKIFPAIRAWVYSKSGQKEQEQEQEGNMNKMLSSIPIPSMDIVMLVAGTYGDVEPFISIGCRLIQDGHRVRIATHACYRHRVTSRGLGFAPLAGDPQMLSQIMVDSNGSVLPSSLAGLRRIGTNLAVIGDIIRSCKSALVPDPSLPGRSEETRFYPNAVISNPIVYGHFHVCEALGIPLHIMFPQPWQSTKAFPHALSGLSLTGGWSERNRLSYLSTERLVWLIMEGKINKLRQKDLGLRPLRYSRSFTYPNLLENVPFTNLWSPSLAPKPKDWNFATVKVAGFVLPEELASKTKTGTITSSFIEEEISSDSEGGTRAIINTFEAFVNIDPDRPPVFITFGSMNLSHAEEERLLGVILEGCSRGGVRVVVQSSTGFLNTHSVNAKSKSFSLFAKLVSACALRGHSCRMEPGKERWQFNDALLLCSPPENCKPIPHLHLFPHCAAVIHHGGSGTTHTGLLCGKPTFIIPFFGDQPFWGACVQRHGAGPPPVAVAELTSSKLHNSLRILLSSECQVEAKRLSESIKTEDGCASAVESFYSHLPLADMVCEVSLFLDHHKNQTKTKTRIASRYCLTCDLKMCHEALEAGGCIRLGHTIELSRLQPYGLKRTPEKSLRFDSRDYANITPVSVLSNSISVLEEEMEKKGGETEALRASRLMRVAHQNAILAKEMFLEICALAPEDDSKVGWWSLENLYLLRPIASLQGVLYPQQQQQQRQKKKLQSKMTVNALMASLERARGYIVDNGQKGDESALLATFQQAMMDEYSTSEPSEPCISFVNFVTSVLLNCSPL